VTRTLRTLAADAEVALLASPHAKQAKLDAEALLLHVLQQNRTWLFLHDEDESSAAIEADYAGLITRRAAGEPIQYITGSTEFFGLPFTVAPDVLIPRPETEHLVEEVIRLAALFQSDKLRIADIGTGSGAIAVALAHSLPLAHIVATDLSPQALVIARQNAIRNDVEDRIYFAEGDLLAPLAGQSFHIIASNPPYIPLPDRNSLSVEIREHEPYPALFGGDDGLSIYRRLIPEARSLLVPDGWLLMEIGYGQQTAIKKLMSVSGYRDLRFIPDYQGISRVAVARRSTAI
jgi:release factor glutamine methyltransferase